MTPGNNASEHHSEIKCWFHTNEEIKGMSRKKGWWKNVNAICVVSLI